MSVKKSKAELNRKLNERVPEKDRVNYQSGHRAPRTRRELLAHGFLAGAGYILVPSIFSLASSAVRGQTKLADCLDVASNNAAIDVKSVRFDFGGGWTPLRAFPVGQNGSFANPAASGADYASIGLLTDNPAAYVANLNTTVLGSGAPIDPSQPFWQGVMAVAAPSTLANVGYEVILNQNQDDTRNIGFGGLGHMIGGISKKGEVAEIVSSNAPNGGTDGGRFNQIIAGQAGTLSVQVLGNASDAAGLVDPGKLLTYFNNDKAAAENVLKGLTATSSAKVQKMLANDDLNTQQAKLIECGYLRANDNLINKVVDPLSDAAFQAVTTGPLQTAATQPLLSLAAADLTSARNGAQLERHMSRFWMTYSGNSTYSVSEQGGHDNHGANGQSQFNKMVEAGMQVGAALEMAALMGTPVMLGIASDGSQAGNGGGQNIAANNFAETRSDNESKGAYINIVYNPNGVQMDGYQVGSINAGYSVDLTSSPMANDVGKVNEHLVDTKLILEGKEPKFNVMPKSNFKKLT